MTAQRSPSAPADSPRTKSGRTSGFFTWVRWPGLIAFVLVVLLIGVVWFMVVDRIAKCLIEDMGTKVVGAKVELAEADVSFRPLGIVLTGLQVTNPDEPMTNAVEVKLIAFSLDGANLLRRSIIIEEMILDGVRFDTPRPTSGAITDLPADGQPAMTDKTSLPLPSFLDVKEILAKEELHSLKFIETLRADIKTEKEGWQKQLAELPDKNKLADYKKRLESLKSAGKGGVTDIVGGASDLLAIQKEINQDLDRIAAAKKSFEENTGNLRRRLEAAAKIPEREARRLREQYALSPEGLTHLSGTLIEGPFIDKIHSALRWYRRMQPYLRNSGEGDARTQHAEVVTPLRGKGTDVKFRDLSRTPDFLIRTAKLKLDVEAGTIRGLVQNMTTDQPTLGLPLNFSFSGEKLKGLQSVSLSGEINRLRSQPRDTVVLTLRGYHVQNVVLSDRADFPVTLKSADADLNGRMDILGRFLRGTITAKFTSLDLDTGANGTATAKAVAKTLSDIKDASIKAQLGGTVQSYGMEITTDVDQVLKRAVGKQLKDQADKLEGALRTEIAAKVNKPLSDLKADFGGLHGIGDELTARLQQAGGLTKSGGTTGLGGLKLPF